MIRRITDLINEFNAQFSIFVDDISDGTEIDIIRHEIVGNNITVFFSGTDRSGQINMELGLHHIFITGSYNKSAKLFNHSIMVPSNESIFQIIDNLMIVIETVILGSINDLAKFTK